MQAYVPPTLEQLQQQVQFASAHAAFLAQQLEQEKALNKALSEKTAAEMRCMQMQQDMERMKMHQEIESLKLYMAPKVAVEAPKAMEAPKVAVEAPKVAVEAPKAMEAPKVAEEAPKVAVEAPKVAVEAPKAVPPKMAELIEKLRISKAKEEELAKLLKQDTTASPPKVAPQGAAEGGCTLLDEENLCWGDADSDEDSHKHRLTYSGAASATGAAGGGCASSYSYQGSSSQSYQGSISTKVECHVCSYKFTMNKEFAASLEYIACKQCLEKTYKCKTTTCIKYIVSEHDIKVSDEKGFHLPNYCKQCKGEHWQQKKEEQAIIGRSRGGKRTW
jgi:hypothetical protein